MKKNTTTTSIDASSLVLWAAAKFAQENNKPVIAKNVQELFAKYSTDTVAQTFLDFAFSGMPKAIMPFARDPIDTYAVALNIKNIRNFDVVFFDEASLVEAGYFLISNNEVKYIDAVQPIGKSFEYFNADEMAHVLRVLAQLNAQPPILTMLEDDESDLQIHTSLANLISSKKDDFEVDLYIFDFEKVRNRSTNLKNCHLGQYQLRTNTKGFTLKITQAEKLLELHAASLQGYWMFISSSEFEFICELPDFSEEAQKKSGYLYPFNMLQQLTPKADEILTVDLQEAVKLFGSHCWFSCNTLDQLLEVIALSGRRT
jgi:hypothetical protein